MAQEKAMSLSPWLMESPLAIHFTIGLVLGFLIGSANLVALLATSLQALGLDALGTSALILGGGVGCTGPLLVHPTLPSLRLALVLGIHRLLVAGLFLWVPWHFSALATHVVYHFLALVSFPALYPSLWRMASTLYPLRHDVAPRYLRPEALKDPPLAQALALRELSRIGDTTRGMLAKTVEALSRDAGTEDLLMALEDKVDRLSREVLLYISALPQENKTLILMKAASELEHMADLVKRMLRKAQRLWDQGITFSPEGRKELTNLSALILERLDAALTALATSNAALAERTLAERRTFREALEASREAHLARLKSREETRASTLTHLDLLLLLEEIDEGIGRIGDLVCELHNSRPIRS
ncbi:PhoU domain-containing protein [Thermus caldilimi]|uniref:PhoU domain-containing protein n=1 Tax=Thermus caldilimi TaxID=2483360 RepID=UPI001F103921|nr:PhoU domain-containing protein [Thermus caldilimi]